MVTDDVVEANRWNEHKVARAFLSVVAQLYRHRELR